jgi:hypothetical protein
LINNNRQQQQGRRRGRRPQNNNGNRNENGSRIDSRARGNAPQMLEKYKNMARDAQLQGDRVMTEYYLQFADHYFRIVAEQRARFEETRRPREDWQEGDAESEDQDNRASSDGNDYDDEDGGEREQQVQQPRRDARPPRERNDRNDGNRNDNNRDRDGNREPNRNANRDERPAAREDRGNNRNRNTNRDGNRDYGNRGEGNGRDIESVPDTIDIAVLPPSFASDGPITPIDDLIPSVEEAPAPPKRRGRPKKVEAEAVEG